MPQSYEVKVAFVAVHPSANHAFEAVTLQRGAIITVEAKRTSLRSGLVEVLFEGTVLAAYLRDIEDWTERVAQDKGQEEGGQNAIASGKAEA